MKVYTPFFVVLLLFVSCSESSSSESQSTLTTSDTLITGTIPEISEVPEGWTEIKFPDLTLLVENIEMGWYDMDSFDDKICEADDTAYFNLYPGDWMDDKKIQVMEPEYDEVQLYVQEVVHVAMSSNQIMEVPFCVMSDWKSISSDWVEVKQSGSELSFGSGRDIQTDTISYTLDEYKEAVRESCGETWYEEILEIDNMEDLPASEFTSQYNFKIVVRNSQTGKTIEHIIVFYTPTSC